MIKPRGDLARAARSSVDRWGRTPLTGDIAPQQITAPVPDSIAQLCLFPAAIAIALPALPSTDAGELA